MPHVPFTSQDDPFQFLQTCFSVKVEEGLFLCCLSRLLGSKVGKRPRQYAVHKDLATDLGQDPFSGSRVELHYMMRLSCRT